MFPVGHSVFSALKVTRLKVGRILLCRVVHALLAFGIVLTFLTAFSIGIPEDQRPMYGVAALIMLAAGSMIAGAVSSQAVGSLPSGPVKSEEAYFAVHAAISKGFPYFAPPLNERRKARIRARLVARGEHAEAFDETQGVLRKHFRFLPSVLMTAFWGSSHLLMTGVWEDTASSIYSTLDSSVPFQIFATAVVCALLAYSTFVVSIRATLILYRNA